MSGEENGLLRIKEGQEAHGQHVVRANPHEHLILPHAVPVRQMAHQLPAVRVRIEPLPVCVQLLKGFFHPGAGG